MTVLAAGRKTPTYFPTSREPEPKTQIGVKI